MNPFLEYLQTSAAQLGRGARAANAVVSPWQYFSPTDIAGFAPGGGIVQGNQDILAAKDAWTEGNYPKAVGLGAQSLLNTGLDVLPMTSALPAINLFGAKAPKTLMESWAESSKVNPVPEPAADPMGFKKLAGSLGYKNPDEMFAALGVDEPLWKKAPEPSPEQVFANLKSLAATGEPAGLPWSPNSVYGKSNQEAYEALFEKGKAPYNPEIFQKHEPAVYDEFVKAGIIQPALTVEELEKQFATLIGDPQWKTPSLPSVKPMPDKEAQYFQELMEKGWPLQDYDVEFLKDNNWTTTLDAFDKAGLTPTHVEKAMQQAGTSLDQVPWTPMDQYKDVLEASFGDVDKGKAFYKTLTDKGGYALNDDEKEMISALWPEMKLPPKEAGLVQEVSDGPASRRASRMLYEDKIVGPPVPKREDLPMDEASRWARSVEQGYGQTLYTGVPQWGEVWPVAFRDPQAAKPGKTGKSEKAVFLSDQPKIASEYAGGGYGGAKGTVVPVRARMENPYETNWIEETGGMSGFDSDVMEQLINDAIDAGHDSAIIRGMRDIGSDKPQDQYLVFNPNQLRSIFARFDPKNIHANDLTAAMAAALGLGAAGKEIVDAKQKR